MKQRSLFETMAERVNAPTGRSPIVPYARGSDTSKAAADSMRDHVTAIAEKVLAEIRQLGDEGATCDMLEYRLELSHQTCSARVNELRNKGRIVDSGQRRKTRSGRNAAVWRAV